MMVVTGSGGINIVVEVHTSLKICITGREQKNTFSF